MQETTNYGLKKPEANDNVEIADLNDNTDIIDRELKKLADDKAPKDVATTSTNGLMSKADKAKLDGLKEYIEFTPTLLAGWVDMDGNIRCKYWKDSIGQVHIIGTITGGANESVPFWLPESYKPSRRMDFACIQQYEDDGPARIRIRSDGAVIIYKSSRSIYIDFGEIIFQL